MASSQFIVLDNVFSKAFIGAALEGNYVVTQQHQNEIIVGKDNKLSNDFLLDRKSTKKLGEISLEMALLFDKVHLFGIPSVYNLDKLEKEDLLGAAVITSQFIEGFECIPFGFVSYVKQHKVRNALSNANTTLHFMGYPELAHKVISVAFDIVENMMDDSVNAYILSSEIGLATKEFSRLTDGSLIYSDMIIEYFRKTLIEQNMQPIISVTVLHAVFSEIINSWTLLAWSTMFGEPVLTSYNNTNRDNNNNTINDYHEAYVLCKVAMFNSDCYVPVVNSIDDLLRLRRNEYISRFRELIRTWSSHLSRGDVSVLSEIRADIEKANNELRKLERVKKVDRWLYYTQLPVSMIPVLSSIVTFAAFASRAWIEKTEKNHSWVNIVR